MNSGEFTDMEQQRGLKIILTTITLGIENIVWNAVRKGAKNGKETIEDAKNFPTSKHIIDRFLTAFPSSYLSKKEILPFQLPEMPEIKQLYSVCMLSGKRQNKIITDRFYHKILLNNSLR